MYKRQSLNTFLNAMTYPDKTVYPVASCNDKDFQNLMHVYMDAVLYPNIYKHEEIFRQEGWSYQLDSVEDKLKYNGVVYNEMKGAFSSPEGVLDRVVLNTLFPDTSYANESCGEDVYKRQDWSSNALRIKRTGSYGPDASCTLRGIKRKTSFHQLL